MAIVRTTRWVLAALLVFCITQTHAAADPRPEYRLEVAPQLVTQALKEFAHQTKLQVVYYTEVAEGLESPGASGSMSLDEALTRILNGTGLEFIFVNERTVAVRAIASQSTSATHPLGSRGSTTLTGSIRLAQGAGDSPSAAGTRNVNTDTAGARAAESPQAQELPGPEETGKAMPEVLVLGGKSLNMDVKRTRDDIQPYVIFDRTAIERSGATTVDGFLKQHLVMNTVGESNDQAAGVSTGSTSSINLRGLGASQTLILIDGHRAPTINLIGNIKQTDINGIPLAAIERIEVLPATASGIYGGSATGGVINIVRRRDYVGLESKVSYENTFDTDASLRRVDVSAGFNLEAGRTNILLAASYADGNSLFARDRDLIQRGRTAILANNPASLFPPNTPPLGATTNIRSATLDPTGVPANLTLDDGTPLNSAFTSVPVGYAGAASDNGQALLANAGIYNFGLANSAQTGGGRAALLNTPTIESVMATIRREFSSRIEAFLDAAASNNSGYMPSSLAASTFTIPATAPNNPFQQNIQVRVPIADADDAVEVWSYERRLVGGLIVRLPGGWSGELDYTWHRSRFFYNQPGGLAASTTTAIQNGSLDVLRDLEVFPLNAAVDLPSTLDEPSYSTLKDATLRAAGHIGHLPGGAPTVSALLEHRDERYDDTTSIANGMPQTYFPSRDQTVMSAYIETTLPFFSERNALPGVRELELQLAGRHDRYEVNGVTGFVSLTTPTPAPIVRQANKTNSTDYTMGLRYAPVRDVVLRTSYGTGFLPPSMNQVVANTNSVNANTIFDPRRGNMPVGPAGTRIPIFTGGNPDLGPEESESWSAGIIFTPRFAPGLRLSADYTQIDKTDNISFLTSQTLLDNESLFPGRVTRAASCPGDPFEPACPVTFLDTTSVNIARAKLEALDLQLDYTLDTQRFGTFDFYAIASRQFHFQTQLFPTSPVIENVGINATISIPLELKANVGVTWDYAQWTLGWSARYFDSYLAANPVQTGSAITLTNQGNGGRISSQDYHDAFALYRFDAADGILSGMEVQVGFKNVFNEEPPFDASNTSYYYSRLGDPRLRSYYVSLKKSF